jgi:aminopeptidase
MNDPRLTKLAALLVEYSTAVKPGDKVLINGSTIAAPLLQEVYAAVLRAGGYPLMLVSLPELDDILYRWASDDQLRHLPPPLMLGVETYDCSISISGANNTKNLSAVDPLRTAMRSQGRRPMLDTFMRRAAEGSLRWTGTLFPTTAYAQDAEMSLSDYEDFVYGACMPDMDDPIAYWRSVATHQRRICDWLKGRKEVRVSAPGTELTLAIENRIFVSCDGRHNMPDGEIFTGPVEDSVEGFVTFTFPAIYQGREVSGVRLELREDEWSRPRPEKRGLSSGNAPDRRGGLPCGRIRHRNQHGNFTLHPGDPLR